MFSNLDVEVDTETLLCVGAFRLLVPGLYLKAFVQK